MNALSIPDAVSISLVGFAIVFVVLVILMAMINAMRAAVAQMESTVVSPSPASAPVAAGPVANPNMVPAKGSLGEVKLYDVDDKTAAMIMAIVADKMSAPLNELRFHSICEKK